MSSTHSQPVLKMLNDKLLKAYEKYYGDLKVGDMSPEEFIRTYGTISDRVNSNLKVGVVTPDESTSISTKGKSDRSSLNDSQNVA